MTDAPNPSQTRPPHSQKCIYIKHQVYLGLTAWLFGVYVTVGGALCLVHAVVGGVFLSACDWEVVVCVSVCLPHAGVHGVGVSVPAAPHHPDRASTPFLQHLLQAGRETAAACVLMSP